MKPCLDVAVIRDPQAFAALEEEWDDLYQNSPLSTPFQSWAWLYSWWEHYGESYDLRLTTLRSDGGLLVGLLPLMLERRAGFGRLLFVGNSPYQDLLVRHEWEAQVGEAGRRSLRQMGSWSVADLQMLRPQAAAWSIFESWAGPQTYVWQHQSPVIDIRPWDEALASLSKKRRKSVRQTLRRAEADGITCKVVTADDADQAACRLVALSREQWSERWLETGPEHWTKRYESFVRTLARRMTACRLGGICEFRQDGDVIMAHFLIFGRDTIHWYLVGAGRRALERYQFSSLFIWDGVNIASNRNARYFDLGYGKEPHKMRWSSRVVPTHRILLGRSRLTWIPYLGYHILRSRAKRYVYSKQAPRWLEIISDLFAVLKRNTVRIRQSGSFLVKRWFKGA